MSSRYPTVYLEFTDFKTSVSGVRPTVLEEIAAISRQGSLFCDGFLKTREEATASSLLFDTSHSYALNLLVSCGL
jgi:hypothetical protein